MATEKRELEIEEEVPSKKPKLDGDQEEVAPTILEFSDAPLRGNQYKKMALCLSYCGKGYYGMQRNPEFETIESRLMSALLQTKLITKQQHDNPVQIKFQRAARTDKGVSAVRQVVSLKLPRCYEPRAMVASLNHHLPPEIRVIDICRTTQSFNAKLATDARIYSYLFPTIALAPAGEPLEYSYRLPEARWKHLNEVLTHYIGHHNFHNFTSGRKPDDASANRYIISCECEPAKVIGKAEFACIKIKGQSFMLHQIRKMVGLAFAIVKGLTTLEVLKKSWEHRRVDVPKAPGLGLVLEEVCYEHYNRKYGSDGMHSALTWDQYQDTIQTFREEYIDSTIISTEVEEQPMKVWLETLPCHSYDYRESGAPGAPVPAS